MGNCVARVFRRRKIRRQIVLILIGLDNAGKTKTVNNLAGDKEDKVLPTVGFKAVNLIHRDTPVTIYDLGGGPQFRQIWPQYYSEVHGVIFVIDASDFSRLEECRNVLEEVLSHDRISGKPVLILANKQDKRGALDDIDVVEKLNVEPLVNRYRCPTLVESYSAELADKTRKPKIDPGLRKGYTWLLNYILKRYGDINLRVQTDIHAELERRRQMMKSATRASQTFTAVSDEIATQTGFENPNFTFQKNSISKETPPGVILVKPSKESNSVNSTMTLESEPDSSVKPKLSPFFGRASDSSVVETVKIELEPRAEFRKLSPIRKSAQGSQNIFRNTPQSSSSIKDSEVDTSKISSKDTTMHSSSICTKPDTAANSIDRNRTWDPTVLSHRVFIGDNELMQREVVLTDRDYTAKTASSDILPAPASLPPDTRPASASQVIRRQLEYAHNKRRFSFRFSDMQRNKTSPERLTMLIYEQSKPDQRRDKGDFSSTATATN